MNKSNQSKMPVQQFCAAVICMVVIVGLASTLWSAEPKSDVPPKTESAPPQTNSVASGARSPHSKQATAKKQLTGAELYSMHCNRCHPERYPTERTAAQWKTILLHMQVRANLPVGQAKLLLKYLQENSGR
jgi:hypothetical protein